ncbi:MAG TPA: cytochrome b5-like heme/steroid binding domain-containing protein [Propionibacteriaceae bacterium]|nr:cytochrome b5-like heme/steroid binding domain-containing protein [Propionibacteriaceae bacterium]
MPLTVAELARHNDREHGWWVAVGYTVYDVTEFLRRHPGGAAVLQAYAGLDATAAFSRAHRPPGGAYRLQRRYAVGRLHRPPDEDPGSAYGSTAAALRHVVELQNTFRLDRFFLRDTLPVDPSGAPATAFQVDRAEDLHTRSVDSYLPALRSGLWDLGTVTGRRRYPLRFRGPSGRQADRDRDDHGAGQDKKRRRRPPSS